MTRLEMIKQLRETTQAGMNDCKAALDEANGDFEKAVDIIKVKGQYLVDRNSHKTAAEGVVAILNDKCRRGVMVEVNCQTDFVAKTQDFLDFASKVASKIALTNYDEVFSLDSVDSDRAALAAQTKENIVVRRWWIKDTSHFRTKVFHYVHGTNKIGVLVTLHAPNLETLSSKEFEELGQDLTLQVAAMNPLAVSEDQLPPEIVERQRAIFETKVRESGKPEASWEKIMDGQMRKWYSEVCLLNQESITTPKVTVEQLLNRLNTKYSKLGDGGVIIVDFIRCQVGEGLETKQEDFADEVKKLIGDAE